MNKRGILFIVLVLMSVFIVYAATFSDLIQSDFNNGTYSNTTHDGTGVVLSAGNFTGTYISRVFDAGNLANWNNLTWQGSFPQIEYTFAVDNQADIWKSSDSGVTWSLVKDDYNGADGNGVTASFFNTSKSYFIIYNQDVWISQDYATFTKVNGDYNGAEGQNAFVATSDKNNNIFIIEGDQDVWKSTDSGLTFTKTTTDFNGGNGNFFGLVSDSNNDLYGVDNQADIWKSSDSGVTWSLVKDDYNVGAANGADGIAIDSNSVLYVIDLQDVWKSSDSGVTWTKINDDFNGAGDAKNAKSIITDSNNSVYIIDGGEDVFKSTDNGVTFTKVATNFNGADGIAPTMATVIKSTNLTFQIKNCSLSNCSDAIFTGPDGTSSSFYTNNFTTINKTGRYFQYKIYFSTQDTSITSTLSNVSINYNLLDTIPPNLTIISPLNQSYNNATILVNISAADPNMQLVWWYNGTANLTYIQSEFYTFPQGSNTLIAYANDSLGNINSTSVSFYIDSIAPTINIILPETKTYGYNTSLPLNFSVSDSGIGVQNCWYNINNGENITLDNCQNTTFNASDGSNNLYLYANDSLGNINSATRNFSVNTQIAVSLQYPADDAWLNYNQIQFNYTVNTATSIKNCSLFINSLFNQTNSSTINTTGNINNFLLNLSDGSYIWNVFCSDTYSSFALNNYTLNIDTTPPSVSISEPTGTKSSRTNIPSSWTISEQNPNSCWYNLYRGTNQEITNTSINCTKTSTFFNVTLDAEFTFNFYSNDSAGNQNSASSSFIVSTSTPPSTPPSSGGDGGGGSSTSFIQQSKLEIGSISNMIIPPGKTEKMSLHVKNTGATFLNNCKLRGSGDFSYWIMSSETKGLSSGEAYDFIFTINVPSGTKADSYPLTLNVECQEASKSLNFLVDIIEKKMEIKFIDIKRGNNNLKVIYSLEELSDINQDVTIQILLFGTNNERIGESTEKVTIEAKTKKQLETILNVSSSMKGIYNLFINANSDTASTFVQEEVVVSNPSIGGLATLFEENRANMLLTLVSIIIFAVFTIFVIRRMIRYKNLSKVKKIESNYVIIHHQKH